MGYLCTRKAQYAPLCFLKNSGDPDDFLFWWFTENTHKMCLSGTDHTVTIIFGFTMNFCTYMYLNGSHGWFIGSQVFEWVRLLQLFLGFRFTSIFHTYEKLVVQKVPSYHCESHIRNTRPCGPYVAWVRMSACLSVCQSVSPLMAECSEIPFVSIIFKYHNSLWDKVVNWGSLFFISIYLLVEQIFAKKTYVCY